MGVEIERKFLVADDFVIPTDAVQVPLRQAYVTAPDAPVEVRVRAKASGFLMALKAHSDQGDCARQEVEFEVPAEVFEQVWALAGGQSIAKVRHQIPLAAGLVAELDVYSAPHTGLRTVEVEFADLAAAEAFTPPDWFGAEVTGQARYANRLLAAAGAAAT